MISTAPLAGTDPDPTLSYIGTAIPLQSSQVSSLDAVAAAPPAAIQQVWQHGNLQPLLLALWMAYLPQFLTRIFCYYHNYYIHILLAGFICDESG